MHDRTFGQLPEAWLDDEAEMVGADLPMGLIGQTLVRQGRLSPARVDEADIAVFRGEIAGCRLANLALDAGLQRLILAELQQELVDIGHPWPPSPKAAAPLHIHRGLSPWTLSAIARDTCSYCVADRVHGITRQSFDFAAGRILVWLTES